MKLVENLLHLICTINCWAMNIISVLAGLYVGGWLMFIRPIMTACAMFDAGTLTAVIIGKTVLSCLFAGIVGTVIVILGLTASKLVYKLSRD